MNKKFLQTLIAIILLAACSPARTATPVPATQNGTATSSPIPTDTSTSIPTETPTASITPLPTIPTFTPTFDAQTIITVTPGPKAECPKENPEIVAFFATPVDGGYTLSSAGDILTYLNAGGALAPLGADHPGSQSGATTDLTGDGLNEVVFDGLWRYDILGCKDGKYEALFGLEPNGVFSIDLEEVLDLNKNGIPELIFYSFDHYGSAEVYIVEWDGSKFRSLIDAGTDASTGTVIDAVLTTDHYQLMDTNGNGLKEIVLEDNLHLLDNVSGLTLWLLIPFRKETISLSWNGKNFVNLKQGNYAPPQYRFQAIQDGDQQARYGNYAEALSFYQAAIFDDRLEWWSPERNDYEVYVYNSQFDSEPIASPTPILDNTEYPRLAAYAYYRIMLLHIVQGHEPDAGTVYKTLGQKFSDNPYGHPYFEMATAFWNAYQSTHKMYDGCAAAIQYAVEYPKILVPLGSDYHGEQSHMYVPTDVCPFR